MKIVIIRLNVGDFGKIGTYNVQEIGLANALIKKGNEVVVIYLNRDTKSIVRDETYDYVYYLPHISFGLHGIFNLKLLDKFEPEQIILFSDNQFWAKNVILWSKERNIGCIHYFGGVLSDNPRLLNQIYTKLILKRNAKSYSYSINIAKTNKVQEEMLKLKVPFKKVINVGLDETILKDINTLDLNQRQSLGFKDDELILLFVGRLIDYKKPLFACDILLELMKRGIKSKLIIIGKGNLESELHNYIKENSLESSVIWKKRVPYEDMYKYLISSDCFMNFSPIEIFGMAILEAMYYGVPVVANHAPGPNEIIEDNISGYFCESANANVWADKVLLAIENKESISSAAHRRIMDKFIWYRIADEFIELFDKTGGISNECPE